MATLAYSVRFGGRTIFWYFIAVVITFFAYRNLSKKRSKVISAYPEVFNKKLVALNDSEVIALRNFKNDTKQFLFTVIIVFGLAFWWGTYQPIQVKKDLELQAQTYSEKVTEGWQYICDDVFSNFIGNGTYLYANDNRYDSNWCKGLMTMEVLNRIISDEKLFIPSEYSDAESAGEKGFSVGARFAIEAVFSRVPYLCFGEDCINDVTVWDYYLDASRDSWYP